MLREIDEHHFRILELNIYHEMLNRLSIRSSELKKLDPRIHLAKFALEDLKVSSVIT